MPLLDAIKGTACLLIVGHHLSRYGPMPEGAAQWMPRLIGWLADQGRLMVQVFLVIGGFLAAGSLAPDGKLRADRPLQRIFQRYGRLTMPYLAALCLSVLVAWLVRPWLGGDLVPRTPSVAQLLAHSLLLQDVLGYDALSAGVWYVAIDFQLFALALIVIVVSEWLRRRWPHEHPRLRWLVIGPVLALVLVSLVVFNRQAKLDVTALYFFGAYGLGMVVFWVGRIQRTPLWMVAMLVLLLVGIVALACEWRSRIAVALVMALSLALIQRTGWGDVLPRWTRPLLRIGRMSYSLFLIHFSVILLVNAVVVRWGSVPPWVDVIGMALTVLLSIGAGGLLYRWVEKPSASWWGVLALIGVFLGCGFLVSV